MEDKNNGPKQSHPSNEQVNENTDSKQGSEKKGSENGKKKNSFMQFIKKNPVVVTALLGVLAVVIVFFWKDMQRQKQTQKIIKVAAMQLEEKNQEMLGLIARPLVWAIRSEMLRGNMEQVDILTTDMVKENNFQFLYLIGPDGDIILSTDKKKEGQKFEESYQQPILTVESTIVFLQEENLIIVASPVMGYDMRLATLVMAYKPEIFKDR